MVDPVRDIDHSTYLIRTRLEIYRQTHGLQKCHFASKNSSHTLDWGGSAASAHGKLITEARMISGPLSRFRSIKQ